MASETAEHWVRALGQKGAVEIRLVNGRLFFLCIAYGQLNKDSYAAGKDSALFEIKFAFHCTMKQDLQPLEQNRGEEAVARRRRLGEQFDRAAFSSDEALVDALTMLKDLRRDTRWQPAPTR